VRGILEAITEAIKLADRVERLGERVAEMARAAREDSQTLHARIDDLGQRLARIEGMIEFAQRTPAARRLPGKSSKRE
jgi:hypothetical protein